MASGSENWSVSDYLDHFEKEIGRAAEDRFKVKFRELTDELSLLDAEFMTMKRGCGGDMDKLLALFHSLSGRLGYCERPRGFERDCDALYTDVDRAVAEVRGFRNTCSL